jgi:hypothetical protein
VPTSVRGHRRKFILFSPSSFPLLHRNYETCCGLSLWRELGAKELTQKFLKIKFAFGAIWRFRADASAE